MATKKGAEQKSRFLENSENLSNFSGNKLKYVLPNFSVYGNKKGGRTKRQFLENSVDLSKFLGNKFKYVFTHFFGLRQKRGSNKRDGFWKTQKTYRIFREIN
jgi:hypothetical protein